MGLTIHYGFFRERMPEEILKEAEEKAKLLGFEVLGRSWNKLILLPDEDCESIELHFHKVKTIKAREGWDLEKAQLERKEAEDDEWYAGGFCKTHYAGYQVHIKVAEFLRWFAGHCSKTDIHDESDYYERGYSEKEVERLKEYLDGYNKMLGNIGAQIKQAFGSENVLLGSDMGAKNGN